MLKINKELLEHLETYSIEELEEVYGLKKNFIKDGRSIIFLVNMILQDVCSEVDENESDNR